MTTCSLPSRFSLRGGVPLPLLLQPSPPSHPPFCRTTALPSFLSPICRPPTPHPLPSTLGSLRTTHHQHACSSDFPSHHISYNSFPSQFTTTHLIQASPSHLPPSHTSYRLLPPQCTSYCSLPSPTTDTHLISASPSITHHYHHDHTAFPHHHTLHTTLLVTNKDNDP